jgi:formamidopyrimidine-DNA glycosylase
MVEGHQCHRVAVAHRKLLVGKVFSATSPNARFTVGAGAISGHPLAKIEVHGKNLFYFFRRPPLPSRAGGSCPPAHDVVHIHFGMAGAFKTMEWPGQEPTATTRLRLESADHRLVAHLSAMTVHHGDDAYYECALALPHDLL